MYRVKNKRTIITVLWLCLSLPLFAWAQGPSDDDAAGNAKPLSQAEIDQFQTWLKNNKQSGVMSAPPGASTSSAAFASAAASSSAAASPSVAASPSAAASPSIAASPSSAASAFSTTSASPVIFPSQGTQQTAAGTAEAPALITTNGAYEEVPPVISPPMSYNRSQRVMLQSAPASPPPSQDSIDAFNAMMQQSAPLTPQQVVKLRQLIDQSQRAAAIPATVPPKPVSSTLIVNLAPGTTPPAIRLAQGYVTSLVFVDSAGSPWPINSYDLGNSKTASIQWDQKSNILLIQAIAPYGDSDLIIRLSGLPTPLTLELVSGQRVVDYRTDIHVPGIGPNTKDLPIGTALPGSANQLLLNVLDGIAPPGSKPLTVVGGDCLAWLLGDTMYLRSRLTVLSPGWTGRMVSPDGMAAYEIPKSSTVLVSQYGQPLELKIEGF